MSNIVPAYYVSTTGSDSNPGTLAAPFLTFTKAQQAMQTSNIKTTYILPGTYSPGVSAYSSNGSVALDLTSADSGETWSYYPPDGYGSAQITGGGTISTFMEINGATGVGVNGLDISNFTSVGIYATNGGSNATIINNVVHDMPQLGIAINDEGAAVNDTLISNNYLYNIGSNGISIYSIYGNGSNDNTINNNIIVNAASTTAANGYADAGSIYAQDLNSTKSTGNIIEDNYIDESHGMAVYLDDGASNFTVTGNILDPGASAFALVQIHGGENNVFSGNIGDISSGLLEGFVFYQQSGNSDGATGMTGNVWENNILVGDIALSGGIGYVGGLDPPAPLTIADNDYWNYGSGGDLVSIGNGGAGSDTDPTYEDPQLSGWTYDISGGSPVFGLPVNFPSITSDGGPPGLAWMPVAVGTPLSPPPPLSPATAITVDEGPQTVIGAVGDTITGGSGIDLISGAAGSMSIIGGFGASTIWGGPGDAISGGSDTTVIVSPGDELLAGGSGATTIWGGTGDTIWAAPIPAPPPSSAPPTRRSSAAPAPI